MPSMGTIEFKGDGAFERAFKTTCKKHNNKHLWYKQCPECVNEAKERAIADLNHHVINACMNIYGLTETCAIQDEADAIMDAMDKYMKSFKF